MAGEMADLRKRCGYMKNEIAQLTDKLYDVEKERRLEVEVKEKALSQQELKYRKMVASLEMQIQGQKDELSQYRALGSALNSARGGTGGGVGGGGEPSLNRISVSF